MNSIAKPIIDTVIHQKVIVDTIRASSKDSMDLLTKMDAFYSNAWAKLIVFVTIAFSIIGIVVPALIQWYQKRELKISEDRLKSEIKLQLENATSNLKKEFEEYTSKQMSKLQTEIIGTGHHLQAIIMRDNNKPIEALIDYIKAAISYFKIKNPNLPNALQGIKNSLARCSKVEVDNALAKEKKEFSDIIKIYKEADKDSKYKKIISEIEKAYLNLDSHNQDESNADGNK